jgi:hypothetical protein
MSGPGVIGVIQGTGNNGDLKSFAANNAPCYRTAYHGLVRVVVRVMTSMAAFSEKEQALLQAVDGTTFTTTDQQPFLLFNDSKNIVIEASSPGFESVRLTILTSIDGPIQVGLGCCRASMSGKIGESLCWRAPPSSQPSHLSINN